ncbi:MAG: acetolactate decarboxylase [Mariniphaga sp.]|nr:acetolactate decarboxylase [Mariniphaga sp.]
MNRFIFILIVIISIISCNQKKVDYKSVNSDTIFQYSVFAGLTNKIYDGNLSIGKLKKYGDTGLGTFNGLNGEMIIVEGEIYQLLENGKIRIPDDLETTPFAIISFFEEDQIIQLSKDFNYEKLKALIQENLPSKNIPYTFQIKGKFKYLQCGGAPIQDKPYQKTLSEALVDRPVFEADNIKGTMVGFWFPEYIGKINVPGFHLHFISEDKTFAGHVIDFTSSNLKIQIDYSNGINVLIPDTKEFLKSDFDLSQGYNSPFNSK